MQGRRLKIVAVLIATTIVLSTYLILSYERDHTPQSLGKFSVYNLTSDLGSQFDPGSIQAFGVNQSSIILSGMGYYNKSSDDSLPNLMGLNSLSLNSTGSNMDIIANQYFKNGNVFGTGWNGTSWLLSGEISWPGMDEGAVISLASGKVNNLTKYFGEYFKDGGAWFDAWNGSGWLIAGNSDHRASLVAYYNGLVVNETPLLGQLPLDSWIQLLEWNGTAWLVGGYGVFGFLAGGSYNNLLNSTAFSGSGVYASYFKSGNWYIGGGAPAEIQVINGTKIILSIVMPPFFNAWINGIALYDGTFIIGGKGLNRDGTMHPALYAITINGSNYQFENLTSMLPHSFSSGQVQYLSYVEFKTASGVLIAGQGFYNVRSGFSIGSLAFLTM